MNRIIEYYNSVSYIYHVNFTQSQIAYDYMHTTRGISEDVLEYMMVGYANGNNLLPKDIPKFIIKQSRLFRYNKEFFRNCIVFPCRSRGNTIYFSSRILNGYWEQKYHSPHLHMPGPINFVYNMELLEKSKNKKLFICEGCIDTLTLLSHNRPAVGLFGASRMNDSIASLFVGKTPYFILDCDLNGAGQSASLRNAGILYRNGIRSKICFLPENGTSYDINEFMLDHSSDDLSYIIKTAVPFEKTISYIEKKYEQMAVISDGSMDIHSVVNYYGFKKRRNSKGYKIMCPLPSHKDNNASMQIYSATNSFFCFGGSCLKAGNAIDLIRFVESCTKEQAEEIYSKITT